MIHTVFLWMYPGSMVIFSRNPFYIRSMIHTIKFLRLLISLKNKVAIPSTSGQWFTRKPDLVTEDTIYDVAIPSTSGQWFPQTIYKATGGQVRGVAIPSTSGQWFPLYQISASPKSCLVAIPSTSGQWFPQLSYVVIGTSRGEKVAIPSTSGQWFPRRFPWMYQVVS